MHKSTWSWVTHTLLTIVSAQLVRDNSRGLGLQHAYGFISPHVKPLSQRNFENSNRYGLALPNSLLISEGWGPWTLAPSFLH